VAMDGELRWWWSARETCYQAWQVGPLLFFLVLLPLPGLSMLVVRRWRWRAPSEAQQQAAPQTTAQGLSPIAHQCLRALQSGYRDEMAFWTGFSLYRRLLLVFFFVFITDPAWQSVWLAAVCVLFAVTNMRYHPFRTQTSHRFECFALVTLTLLALSSTPGMARLTMRAPVGLPNEAALEGLQFVLFLLPIVAYVGMHAARALRWGWVHRHAMAKSVPRDHATSRATGDRRVGNEAMPLVTGPCSTLTPLAQDAAPTSAEQGIQQPASAEASPASFMPNEFAWC
jgi:hypothetical protein